MTIESALPNAPIKEATIASLEDQSNDVETSVAIVTTISQHNFINAPCVVFYFETAKYAALVGYDHSETSWQVMAKEDNGSEIEMTSEEVLSWLNERTGDEFGEPMLHETDLETAPAFMQAEQDTP